MDDSDCSSQSLSTFLKRPSTRLIAALFIAIIVSGCDVAPPKENRFTQTVTYVES